MSEETAKGIEPEAETQQASEKEFKPSESGEHSVVPANYAEVATESRADVKDALDIHADVPENEESSVSPTPPVVKMVEVFSTLPPTPGQTEKEARLDQEIIRRAGALLEQETLEAHLEALKILEERGLLGNQRWNEIHTAKTHCLSRASEKQANSFVDWVLKRVPLNETSSILELGCGYGNDALAFARRSQAQIFGVDASNAAIEEGKINVNKRKPAVAKRVTLATSNFDDILEMSRGAGYTILYLHSTGHYKPWIVLRDKSFPLMAEVLRSDQEGVEPGRLCLAMKLGSSASAKSSNQIPLVPNDRYNQSIDRRDKVFRTYPETKEDMAALLEPSFDIEESRVVPVRNYDKKGDTEIFYYCIAKPKEARAA